MSTRELFSRRAPRPLRLARQAGRSTPHQVRGRLSLVNGGGKYSAGPVGARAGAIIAAMMSLSASAFAMEAPNLGKPISPQDLAPWDITIFPDGKGLPAGSGTSKQG